MLVQHFFPPTPTANGDGGGGSSSSSSIRRSSSYSSSSPPSSSVLTNTKKTSKPFSSFFHSESTGFQPTMEESIRMNYNEKIQTHLSAWPRKLTSVMDIHRQGFSQLNPRFKQQQQQQRTTNKSVQQPPVCPVVLPSASRPQPRQQARLKPSPETLPPQQPIRRSTTAHTKPQSIPSEPNNQYLTLANLTKILHVLQTQDQINDHETSTDTSTSTTNSAKQRVQQHLQETATRWWKASRSSDCQSTAPATSTTQPYLKSATPAQVPSPNTPSRTPKQSDNLPLLTIVSNSTRNLNLPPNSAYATSKYDESESSTEIQTIISSIVPLPKSEHSKRTRPEPLLMPARGMRLRSYDRYHYYNNQNNMNFLQQQRLIRQT